MTGIDDLIDEEKKDVERTISSRMDPRNIEVPEKAWKEILAVNPFDFLTIAVRVEENEAKALVSMMDDALEDGIDGWNLHEDQLDEIREAKQEIMEKYNGF